MDPQGFGTALALSLMAWLGTGLGGLAACVIPAASNDRFVARSSAVAAGVMLGLAVLELLPEALAKLSHGVGAAAFVVGLFVFAALSEMVHKWLPDDELIAPAPSSSLHSLLALFLPNAASQTNLAVRRRVVVSGVITTLTLTLHNSPEGLAVLLATRHSLTLALPLALGIAAHNIAEGAAVAVTVFASSGSRGRAAFAAFASGASEPLSVIGGQAVLWLIGDAAAERLLMLSLAAVAGIMVAVVMFELAPTARGTNAPSSFAMYVTAGCVMSVVPGLLFGDV
jgi:zinc transporter ZupT